MLGQVPDPPPPRCTGCPLSGVPAQALVAALCAESYHEPVTRVLLLALALAAEVGCAAHYVSRGADLYAGARYIEAAEVFERTEKRLANSSTPDRARYGLYRGATLLALGDSTRAEKWLAYSSQVLEAEPSALSDEEHTMLSRALRVAATRRGATPALLPAAGTTVATTRSLTPDSTQAPSQGMGN
jgi:hypothetical protein